MRLHIKLIIWLVLCGVLSACRISYPYGITPDILLCFSICFAAADTSFKRVFVVMLVCAVADASLCGLPMLYCVIFTGLCSVTAHELMSGRMKANPPVVALYTAAATFCGETVLYYIFGGGTLGFGEAMRNVIAPVTAANAVASFIICAGVRLTFGIRKRKAVYIKVV